MLFFSLIILASVIAIGLAVISVFSTPEKTYTNNQSTTTTNKQITNNPTTSEKSKKVKEKYKDKLNSLQKKVKEQDLSAEAQLEMVSEFLFTAKVPKQYLDQHLQAAIKFRDVRGNLNNKQETSTKINNLLENILE
jgi:uncharacterized membrane protein YhiD involved in acid resistance